MLSGSPRLARPDIRGISLLACLWDLEAIFLEVIGPLTNEDTNMDRMTPKAKPIVKMKYFDLKKLICIMILSGYGICFY